VATNKFYFIYTKQLALLLLYNISLFGEGLQYPALAIIVYVISCPYAIYLERAFTCALQGTTLSLESWKSSGGGRWGVHVDHRAACLCLCLGLGVTFRASVHISPHQFLSFFPSLRKRTNRRIYKVKARGWAMLLPPSPYLARTVAPYTTFIDQFLSQKENVQNMYINICALKSCSSSLLRSQDSGNDTVSPHRTFHNFVSSLLPWSSSCQVMLADGVLFGCSLNPLQCLNMMPTQSVIQQKFSLV
jgi:hypothetical protein